MTETLIQDAQAFLRLLAADNSRDWFQAHKAVYDARLRAPAEALLARLTPALSDLAGAPVAPKLFRANRDVRFSKDKTPYNLHLRMLWSDTSGPGPATAFFFGIDTEGAHAGGGSMTFDGEMLSRWRQMLDLDGVRIGGVVDAMVAAGFAPIQPPDLKRVPQPYGTDHPQADLLRRKGLAMMRPVGEGPTDMRLMDIFEQTQKLNRVISSIG